jgi:hypothetical protein
MTLHRRRSVSLISKSCRKILLTLPVLAALSAVHAGTPAKNVTTVVVEDGPFAGTYIADDTACLRVKERETLGCGWKDFDPPKRKAMQEAGIGVDRPDAPGAKSGDVHVVLSDGSSQKPTTYDMLGVPLTLTRNGRGGTIEFNGKTPDGVRLHMTAICVEVEEF